MKNAIITATGAVALAGFLGFAGSTAASASTPACTGNPQTSFCGSEIDPANNAWKIHDQDYAQGTHVVAALLNDTNAGEDLDARNTTADPNEREFQAAPLGKDSGFCLTQQSGANVIILAPCNNCPSSSGPRWATPTRAPSGGSTTTPGTSWRPTGPIPSCGWSPPRP